MSRILVRYFVLSLYYAPVHWLEPKASEYQSIRALELSNMNLSLILLFGSTLTYSFSTIVAFVPITATLNSIIIITVLLAAIDIINVTVITIVIIIILIIYICVAIFVIVIFNLDISVNPSRKN